MAPILSHSRRQTTYKASEERDIYSPRARKSMRPYIQFLNFGPMQVPLASPRPAIMLAEILASSGNPPREPPWFTNDRELSKGSLIRH